MNALRVLLFIACIAEVSGCGKSGAAVGYPVAPIVVASGLPTVPPSSTPSPAATPTLQPTASPTASPTIAPIATPTPTASPMRAVSVAPGTLTFSNSGAAYAQTFSASETGYTGTFTVSGYDPKIATVSPASSTSTFTVTPVGNGQTTITVTDATGNTAPVTVMVTLSTLGVNAKTR